MFNPKYKITPKLLKNIKKAAILVEKLNRAKYPAQVVKEIKREALVLSAHSSTSIEGNPLTLAQAEKVFKNLSKGVDDYEREVSNYGVAQKLISKIDARLTLNTILKIQKEITRGLISRENWGKLRSQNVYVKNNRIRKIVYMAPFAKDVRWLLKDLVDFCNSNNGILDTLILAGIFHRQFVIIHPFADGNGRTARLAARMILSKLGLENFDIFSFDNFYAKNKEAYFRSVGVNCHYYDIKDKIDFTSWLEYFTGGILNELERVENKLNSKQLSPKNELHDYHKKILKYIETHGFITDKQYSKLTDRAKPTRNLDIRKLIGLCLIKKYGKGKLTYYKFR